jgi:hypothetical protein
MVTRIGLWLAKNWPKPIALIVGLALVILYVMRNDPAALAAGIFLVTLGLFIDRLEELTIAGFKAKLIKQIAQQETERHAMVREAPGPDVLLKDARSETGASIPLAKRTIDLPKPSTVPPRALASNPAEAGWVSLHDVARARTTDELAAALAGYAQGGRRLSTQRLDAEREATAAILALGAERAAAGSLGENTPEENQVADLIEAFWPHPEDLTDEQVVRLTTLVRGLMEKDEHKNSAR